jgi:hypothetical protein
MKFRFLVKQGEPAAIVGRIQDPLGNTIKQGLISSITANCYDLKNNNVQVAGFPQSLSIASVVFDFLQQGPLWTDSFGRAIDTLGYNFSWLTPQNAFPNFSAGQSYKVEIEIVLTNGQRFTGECQCDVSQILTAPLP